MNANDTPPREPTPEMLLAHLKVWHGSTRGANEYAREAWTAMYDAAPKAAPLVVGCRPEDRAMLATDAGKALVAAAVEALAGPAIAPPSTQETDRWYQQAIGTKPAAAKAIAPDDARLRECRKLLTRLANWDMMAQAADGPYWLREIDRVLAAKPEGSV